MTTADRRARALDAVREVADAMLVTHLTNVRYLTGFTGSSGLLVLADAPHFLTDGRYIEQSRQQVPDVERTIYPPGKLNDTLRELLAARGIRRVGFEAAHTSVHAHGRLADALEGVELVQTTDVVEGLRARKHPGEVDAIRRAQRVAEIAVTEVLAAWTGGSEAELALALETVIRTRGGDGVSFEVIVASGDHSALPHARPRRAPVPAGGVLLVDIGARLDGYCSDMTRTYLRGAPDPLPRVHAAVVRALEAASEAVRPGVKASEVDRAAREVLAAEGLGDAFTHSTGHGVGLDIHEAPRLAADSDAILEPGMVVTVEPGAYLPGVGGVRVEDLLVVTESGCENLTALPRSPELPV